MRIAFLTSEYVTEPYFSGGLAQYLGRVTTALSNQGHHVEVFVLAEARGKIEHNGIIVHRVPRQPQPVLKNLNRLLRITKQKPLTETHYACSIAWSLDNALRQRAKKVEFDIVQAASWQATGFFAAKNPVAPVVIRVSSYEPLLNTERDERFTLDKKLYSLLERLAMRRASAVYTPSAFMANQLLKRTAIKASVIRPPYSSTNGNKTPASDELADWPKYLLYFGRVCRYKGAAVLADAIEPLIKKTPNIKLAIAGPISQGDNAANYLLRLAKVYPQSVRYLGTLDREPLSAAIRNSHAIVLPSLMDNLPNTCIEAMAASCVVIGPKGVSFDELIEDGKSGLLFRSADSKSLRKCILRAWNMTALQRSKISKSAKKRISEMTDKKTIDNLEAFYENVHDHNHTNV